MASAEDSSTQNLLFLSPHIAKSLNTSVKGRAGEALKGPHYKRAQLKPDVLDSEAIYPATRVWGPRTTLLQQRWVLPHLHSSALATPHSTQPH